MRNNNTIRLLCFTLALIIALCGLGACKQGGTASTPSDASNSSEVSSSEPDASSEEPTAEEPQDAGDPADDGWYDGLEEVGADEENDNPFLTTANLNIYNKTPVQNDFGGFGGVYHAFPYRSDNFGRQYTEEMAEFEIQRAIRSGISSARTFYEMNSAWDSKTKSWNWESDDMQALYKFCLGLKKGGVEVLINHWYHNQYLFTSYHWSDESADGDSTPGRTHPGITVEGDQAATLSNFADFMAETVRQLRAHGCTNATTISIATEPGAWWSDKWGNSSEMPAYQEKCAKSQAEAINTVSQRLKEDGIRNLVKIQGPNVSGDENAGPYLKAFLKYVDSDACDLISAHKYYGNDLTADNYDLWKMGAEVYCEQTTPQKFVWDEYNCSPAAAESIASRHSAYNGMQLALAQVCFLNYGMKSSYIWSLLDQQWPNNYTTSNDSFKDGVQMCGLAPTLLESSIVFPPYYSFSLVANALGDVGSKVYRGDDDTAEGVYAAMTENQQGEVSIMAVSTNIEDTQLTLHFEKSLNGATLYRHVYNPNKITCTTGGELINPDLKITDTNTVLEDVIEPYCVVVYTTKKLWK